MTEDKCEGECHRIEEWKQLDAKIDFAWSIRSTNLKAVYGVGFLSINHVNLRFAPNASNKLLFIELNDASGVQALQVSFLEKKERVR